MRIPVYNRFILLESQLMNYIKSTKYALPIIDYAVERKVNQLSAVNKINHSIKLLPNNYFAIKLSIFPEKNIYEHLDSICQNAIKNNCKILIDAEDNSTYNKTNKLCDYVIDKYNKDKCIIYKTYQLYRKDSLDLLQYDINNFQNYQLGLKFVRGAYLYQDNKTGLLFNKIDDVHDNYNMASKLIFNNFQNKDVIWATHNERSIDLVKDISKLIDIPNNHIKFAQLMGMKDNLTIQLHDEGFIAMKYVPYGPIRETLPYLFRRLYENHTILQHI
jgi:proline dehydrogenase